MNPIRTYVTRAALVGIAATLVFSGCSSSTKKAADTPAATKAAATKTADSTAAPETTIVAVTTVVAKTAAVVDTTSAAADTTVAAETTTVASGASAASSTKAAATGPLTPVQVKAALTKLKITATDADVACVVREGGTELDTSADSPPPQFMKALLSCLPAAMAKSASGPSVDPKLAAVGITLTQARCFLEKTFRVIGAKDVATIAELLKVNKFADFPEDVRTEASAQGKTCGLNDKQIAALIAA